MYAESTAVLGPLALRAEPGCYDLCTQHAQSLKAPRGWEVIRLPGELGQPEPSRDDLAALAERIREVGLRFGEGETATNQGPPVTRRKGHLAVLADDNER